MQSRVFTLAQLVIPCADTSNTAMYRCPVCGRRKTIDKMYCSASCTQKAGRRRKAGRPIEDRP